MKRFFLLLNAVASFTYCFSQQASQQITFPSAPDRISILRASLALHESEEKIFWPLYEQYEEKLTMLKQSTLESLKAATLTIDETAAVNNVSDLLQDLQREASLKEEYFDRLLSSTNGTIGLQFLQGEALYDLLMKSDLYEELKWQYPRWNPESVRDELLKKNIFENALSVAPEDTAQFRQLMTDFEFDYSRVVGHEFLFFEQYIDDPTTWTPGQCKKLGNAFLSMQLNEVKVKQKYFEQFSEAFDPLFAARLISFQEYFVMMSKLKVWSDWIATSTVEQR
jgi:hypothetical protein